MRCLIAVFWSAVALAQTQPVLIERHEPKYSEEGRMARLNGIVRLRIVVDATGTPRDPQIERALGFGLDEEAITAVATWRFRPGTKDGTPVPVFATVDVAFRLLNGPGFGWNLTKATLPTPDGVSRPRVMSAAFPKIVPQVNSSVEVLFDIDENGVPQKVRAASPDQSPSQAEAIAAAEDWRFTPARKDGFAIPIHASFTFAGSVAGAPASPVRLSAGGVTQPVLIHKEEPEYSDEARRARLEGLVQLDAVVHTNGIAGNFKIRRSLGLGLDEEAIRSVEKWRFRPGAKDGAPVDVFATFDVSFRLLPGNGTVLWRMVRATFDNPEGTNRPVLTHAEYPHSDPGARVPIALSFEIDEHGSPKGLNIDKAADSEAEQQLMAAVKKWKFKPAMKDGKPMTSRATFEFFGLRGK